MTIDIEDAIDDHDLEALRRFSAEELTSYRNPEGYNSLMLCVTSLEGESEEMVRIVLGAGIDIDMQDPAHGFTALHSAAWSGRRRMVEVLLEAGANPNLRDSEGNTPLSLCSGSEKMAMRRALVFAGADPFIRNNHGVSAVLFAEKTGDQEALSLYGHEPKPSGE